MKTPKIWAILAFSTICAVSSPSFGQQRVFNWLPANDESVRLDPANYHSGRTYHPGSNGGNMHVDIKAQQPVTIFMADAARAVFTGLGAVLNPTTGIVDPSNKVERAVGLGIATIMKSRDSAPRHFVAPNDVHIQYYRWDCVENCIQPEYQWIEQVREKYDLTSFLKVYGGFVPDHDGTYVSIRIKSPVPMAIAMLPSQIADQLHAQPGALESALEKNTCQQRGVQSLQFQCTFNAEDGPQSLIAVPESTSNVPHKKAEIEMQAVKCVANCAPPPPLGKQ